MVSHIVSEIKSVKGFFKSRAHLGDGSGDAAMRKNFADSLIKQVNQCKKIGPSDASQINDALKDTPYGDHTARIVNAIDCRLNICIDVQACAVGKDVHCSGQHLRAWWYYLTQQDWDFIRDPKKPWHAKMTRVVWRACLLGITTFNEQTWKWVLAMLLLTCYDELPTHQQIFDKLQELKMCFKAEKRIYPLEHLQEFPESHLTYRNPYMIIATVLMTHQSMWSSWVSTRWSTTFLCVRTPSSLWVAKGRSHQVTFLTGMI